MTNQITDSIGGYLMGMVILAFFNSVVAFLLHLFLGLPYPLLMGVLAFSITIIPLVGPVLYWIIATTLALFTSPALRPDLRDRLPDLHPDRGVRAHAEGDEQGHLDPRVARRHRRARSAARCSACSARSIAIPVTASILLIIKQVFIPRQDAKL